jgi:FAD synthase
LTGCIRPQADSEDLVDRVASDTASVVMTFSPHPLQILHPGKAPKLIIPTDDKLAQSNR